jgi:hypothetical protein
MGDGGVQGPAGRLRGAGWFAPIVLLVLVVGTLVTGNWLVGRMMSEPGGGQRAASRSAGDGQPKADAGLPGSVRGFVCAYVGDPEEDDNHCARAAQDFVRRAEMTPAQQTEARAAAEAVDRAMPAEWPSACRADAAACAGWGPDAPRGSTDLEVFRAAFRRIGLRGAAVRLATGDDPAPRGTVLYAVPVGEVCVVGWVRGVGGAGGHGIEGRLPSGRCLD